MILRVITLIVLLTSLSAFSQSADETEKVEILIKQLGANNFKIRENAEIELKKYSRDILPALEKHKNTKDPEVKIRIRNIIQQVAPTFAESAKKHGITQDSVQRFLQKVGIEYKNLYVRSNSIRIDLREAKATDFSALEGMPITDIQISIEKITRGLNILQNMKSLKRINNVPADKFWKKQKDANKAIEAYDLKEFL